MSDLHERTKEHPSARQIEGVNSSIMSIPRISLLLYKVDQKLHNILVIFVSLQQSPLSNMKRTFIVFGEWRFVFQCQKYCIALLNVLYYCIHWRLFMQINWWQKMMANSHAWIVLNFACESAPTAPIRNRNLRSVHKCSSFSNWFTTKQHWWLTFWPVNGFGEYLLIMRKDSPLENVWMLYIIVSELQSLMIVSEKRILLVEGCDKCKSPWQIGFDILIWSEP